MKKIVLYGAYDRYNYGDNLMPILFEMFIKKYRPEILDEFDIEYAAISKADLSKYSCLPTKSINDLLTSLESDSAVIVIGGEVLCASNFLMSSHMLPNLFTFRVYKKLAQAFPQFLKLITKLTYSAKWEYPFIVNKKCFKNNVKVVYNTIGGVVEGLDDNSEKEVVHRLQESDYISVRDDRTKSNLESFALKEVQLIPDSAYIMSDLVSDSFLDEKVSTSVKQYCTQPFIVLQGAYGKLQPNDITLVQELEKIAEYHKYNVCLLPIGYASGHNDQDVLRMIQNKFSVEAKLMYPLNVWEIMYVIKNAKAYFGTSLHGAITAMSFAVPHFCVNNNVKKLESFLHTWSVFPFNLSYKTAELFDAVNKIDQEVINNLNERSKGINDLIKENHHNMCNVIQGK